MPNVKLGISFLSYTASASSELRPASNCALYAAPRRTWRGTTAGAYFQMDLGTAKTPVSIFLNNCNFPTLSISQASDAAFTTSVVSLGSGLALNVDRRVNRRKGWYDVAGSSRRYLRITPGGTPDGGASYVEIGVVAVMEAAGVVTLLDNPAFPWPYTRLQASTSNPFASGGEDVSDQGVPFLEFQIGNPLWRTTSGIQDQLFSMADLGKAAPWAFWENRGKTEHAYMVRRVSDLAIAERVVTFEASIGAREIP